jgi:hypothetical protein
MPVLTDDEYATITTRVRARWRRWGAHRYYETTTPPRQSVF